MAAIAGGLTEGSIAEAVQASSLGIIYGTAAGYVSGIRKWGTGVSFATARRSDVPLGLEKPGDLPVAQPRTGIPIVSQDIADALESGVFGQITGPYRIFTEALEKREYKVAAAQAKARQAAQVRMVGLAVPPPYQVACNY